MKKLNLIPQVRDLTMNDGSFQLLPGARIVAGSAEAAAAAELLACYLRPPTGFALPVVRDAAMPGDVVLTERGNATCDRAGFRDESHSLAIDAGNVRIEAENRDGLLRAIQTLRQLFPAEIYGGTAVDGVRWQLPALRIADAPEFRWRGMHFDVSRYFFSAAEVCRFIELIAQHKFNMFHWHLTDDQGWRIEIKRYPRLTEIGSIRQKTLIGHESIYPHRFDSKPYGGFYTQDDIRMVVEFAAQRGVTVLPEIDMPGHMQAAITAYPELGNNPGFVPGVRNHWGISQNILNPSPETVQFMKNVLTEVLELFPSRFIHIGGDEALKFEWDNSDYANGRMIELGCRNAHELQSWFIGEMGKFITANGRCMIGWDEILEGGLPAGAAVMSWRGESAAVEAAKIDHDVVMASKNYAYLDYYQADPQSEPLAIGGDLGCEKVYRFHPVPPELTPAEAAHVLGGQGQIWTEYMPNFKQVEYMTYPRACALGEKLWSPNASCRYRDFVDRLTAHRARLNRQNVNAHLLP